MGRGIGACRAECAGASGFFREKTWSCAKKREKKVHSPWPNAYRTRVLKRRQGSYSTVLGRETGNRPLSPMWCCSIIRRTPDMGQGIAVVYLYNSIYTLPLSLIWCSSYYISTPHMGQNPFRRSAHPFPSHFPVHRAWEESFPATPPPNGAAPAAAAGRILPPARTRDGGGGAHRGRRQRSAQGRPRDRWREGRRGRGRRETGQWWLRGRGWSGSAPRRLLQADSVAQSASTIPAVQGHGHGAIQLSLASIAVVPASHSVICSAISVCFSRAADSARTVVGGRRAGRGLSRRQRRSLHS